MTYDPTTTGYPKKKLWKLKKNILVGGFNHLEKYESQWQGFSHLLWIKKHV
jgi:hypothetical protein